MTSNLPENPQWFTIKDAARYLQVGEPTLYRWMREGKITFRKIGDSTRFLQQDLDAMVVVHSSGRPGKTSGGCMICGSLEVVSGKCQSTGNFYFVPEKSKFWTFKTSTVNIASNMCGNCGHISFKGDISHLRELQKEEVK